MTSKKITLACALIALFIVGCATMRAPGTPEENELRISKIRTAYDRGFEVVAASLPQPTQNSPYSELEKLKSFRREMVRWAELRGEKFYTLESAPRNSVWFVVVPPGHHNVDEMVATLQIYATPKLTILLVKPEDVTDRWAGIFLVHELSHLMDRAFDVEPINPTRKQFLEGELRAHQLELMAANLLSKGAIQKQVDKQLSKWQPSSKDELFEKIRNMERPEWLVLEKAMQSEKPASEAELRLRTAFYVSVFVLRYISMRNIDSEGTIDMVDKMLSLHQSGK